MPKFFILIVIVFSSLNSAVLYAQWKLEKATWLNDNFFTLFQQGEESNTGLFLMTNNMESYQFHLLINASTIEKKGDEFPFVIKGEVYFDGEKHAAYELKNAVNVNGFSGADYEFNENFLDAEVYEKLKYAKKFSFHYRGKQGKPFQVTIPLADYYTQFNRFTTQRMYEIVPSFLDYYGKKKYRKLVGRCVAIAEGQVEDIRAKNSDKVRTDRIHQVLEAYRKQKASERQFKFSDQQLMDRVSRAYEFYGDTKVPEWLLYPFFSQCYNKEIENFSA